jgi:DNA modification methylase
MYNQDSRNIKKFIKNNSISTTITSPPYYDMKDYGDKKQIGYGQSYDSYLNDLQKVFKNVYDITKEDGSLWIIIDTFKKNGQVVPLPFDLTSKLVEIGWLLQDIIIWKKDKTVPWSHNGFVQRKFEYILFFTKSKQYKYYKDRVRIYDTSQLKKWWVKYPERYNPKGKALDEVWEYPIPTQGSWGDKYIRHFCPLPMDMIGTMIQLTTDEQDIILDPFAGSGSVLIQASYMNRKYIGFELNKFYIEMFNKYLQDTLDTGRKKYKLFLTNKGQTDFEKTILDLRALKYARVIQKKFMENEKYFIYVEPIGNSQIKNKLIKVKYIFISNNKLIKKNIEKLKELTNKPPLSKFGIEPIFEFEENFDELALKDINIYGYTKTNTYYTQEKIDCIKNISRKISILSSIEVLLNENDYEG